jgi:DNA-binding transcriptional ArsR family regulator
VASTRGKILALLRTEDRTVSELAAQVKLTDNAVRAHLLTLEGDGLVQERGLRPGIRKPHLSYGLSPQKGDGTGVWYSALTGICVGAGTIAFFLLFQKGGPLSAVPMILAGGAAIMAIVGIIFFKEPASLPRVLAICLALAGLFLLRF